MSSTVRWKEDGSEASPELRSMMQHARAQAPDAAQVEALTANVLAQLPAAPGALSTSAGVGLGTKLSLLTAALTALGASVWWSLPQEPASHAPHATPAHIETAKAPAPAASPAGTTAPEPREAAPETAARHAVAGKATRTNRAQPTLPPTSTGSELTLLHAARTAHRRAPREALEMLRQHARDYPQSAFAEEREALTIELLLYFDPVQAAQRLSEFERSYPSSPYRARLQRGP